MLIRWKQAEDTPLRHVPAGTVAETDDALARQLVKDGIAEPVKAEPQKAVRPKGKTAVRSK